MISPTRLAFFAVSATVLASPIHAQSAARVLYDGGDRLPDGWSTTAFRGAETGLDASQPAPGKTASLRVGAASAEVQAWAGGSLTVKGQGRPKFALPVDAETLKNGALNIRINGGRFGNGALSGGQDIQISAEFIARDGGKIEGGYVRIDNYIEGRAIDNDPKTWQRISIPLSDFKISDEVKANIVGITSVAWQFRQNPVISAVNIGYVGVGPKIYDAAERAIAPPATDPSRFAEFGSLKAPYLVPPNPRYQIDANGNFTLDGTPRFLLGAELPSLMRGSFAPTAGYPDALKWLYDKPLDYRSAQRVGLDAVGFFTMPRWITAYDKKYEWMTEKPGGEKFLGDVLREARLPFYVDFTAWPWWHGALVEGATIPDAAKNLNNDKAGNHWVPYAVNDPQGRELYRKIWQDGAQMVKENGAQALYYELFNEPAYNDDSAYNRAQFGASMRAKYGTIEKLNAKWRTQYADFAGVEKFGLPTDNPALFVEWSMFLENSFTDLVRDGQRTIRAIDKDDPQFAVQIMGGDYYRVLPKTNINLAQIARESRVVSMPTGGGIENAGAGGLGAAPAHSIEVPYFSQRFDGMISRHFMRSIGRGKAVVDGEHYFDERDVSDGFWLQLVRGGDAAFIFNWSKRAWDTKLWGENRDAQGGRRLAETFPYNVMNPYSVAPNKIAEIATTKREILSLSDLFVPKSNRSKAQIGVLLSYPTARYSQAVGTLTHHQIRPYATALDFSGYDMDIVLEEQLGEGRLDEYRVLVAPGVENVNDGTPTRVQNWVRGGGTLVLGLEAMQLDPLGNARAASEGWGLQLGAPLDSDNAPLVGDAPRAAWLPGEISARAHRRVVSAPAWKTLARVGDVPALMTRDFGRGRVVFVNAKMPEYALASLLGGVMNEAKIARLAELTRLDNGELQVNIETRKFTAGATSGYFLFNWDTYAKPMRFVAPELAKAGAMLVDPLRKEAFPIANGAATIWIPAGTKRVLVVGDGATLRQRFGALKTQTPADVEAAARAALANAGTSEVTVENFAPDASKLLTVDLRPFANRDFVDGVAGDGKGGWTDQGENSLRGVEWGRRTYLGVPFEIIRPDMNGNNGAIVLASQKLAGVPLSVKNIPLGEKGEQKIKTLYFLHTAAWAKAGQEAYRAVLHHADGTQTEVPMRAGTEIGEWWTGANSNKDLVAKLGWKNSEDKGLWAYEWRNPNPSKAVTSVDLVGSNNDPIPIIVALTAELE